MQLLHLIAATVALPDTLPAPSTYLVNDICWALHHPAYQPFTAPRSLTRLHSDAHARGGDVSIANLTLRPEIVWALDAETVADSNTQLSFAPRFICQRTSAAATAQDCGAGAEVGLSSTSEDGLGSAHIRLVMDRVGNSNRSSFALNFERRF